MSFILNAVNHNGFILPVLVMLPNILWMIWPPLDIPGYASEKRNLVPNVMEILESIGRFAVFIIPLFYSIHMTGNVDWSAIGFMSFMLLLYYIGWMRFYCRGRRYELLFAPLFRIPVPMAVAPVLFFLAGAWLIRS